MQWTFAKYVGCGNDFILFDNREGQFPFQRPGLVSQLCHRQWGIGADGVILLENSLKADFRMRIFNADGSEAEMCGNGIRCLAKWIQASGFPEQSYSIETMERILTVGYRDSDVCVDMGASLYARWNIPITIGDEVYSLHFLDTGVPHVVLFVEDVNAFPLEKLGPFIRHHSLFAPKGTNVNIAQQISEQLFKVRTFERGVEAETLACGTGVTAVALAAAYQFHTPSPVRVITQSETILIVGFHFQDTFSHITLTGPAHCTFEGEIKIPENLSVPNAFPLLGTPSIR